MLSLLTNLKEKQDKEEVNNRKAKKRAEAQDRSIEPDSLTQVKKVKVEITGGPQEISKSNDIGECSAQTPQPITLSHILHGLFSLFVRLPETEMENESESESEVETSESESEESSSEEEGKLIVFIVTPEWVRLTLNEHPPYQDLINGNDRILSLCACMPLIRIHLGAQHANKPFPL